MNLEKDLEKIKELLKDVKYLTLDQITSFLDWSPKKKKDNKKYMIVVVSEGAIEKEGKLIIKKVLEDSSGLDNIRLRRSRWLCSKKTRRTYRNTSKKYYTSVIYKGVVVLLHKIEYYHQCMEQKLWNMR